MLEVLCLRPLSDFSEVGVDLPQGLEVRAMAPDEPGLGHAMAPASALVIPAVGPPLASELFEGSAIRLVQVTGAGVDRVDAKSLAARGIAVANVPGGSARAVAEYVIASASTLLRFMPESTAAIRAGHYAEVRKTMIARGMNQLGGLKLGLIGYGVIGREVATQARARGARVMYHDPFAKGGVSLPDLLLQSDIVSLHVPLNNETRGLLGPDELAAMKPGAILINAARGGVVDEAALASALETGRLGGAAIDVFSTEPPVPDNPLLALSEAAARRTLLTPHIAGVTRQAWATLFREAWNNVERFVLRGEYPLYVVNAPQPPNTS